jgi:phosphoserine phosphatase RsbU/P
MSESAPRQRVLLADDQPAILDALHLLLRTAGFDADTATSVDGVRERLSGARYDLLLMDLNYARDTTSGREGLDLITEVHAHDCTLPIVVMTGWGSIETAVEAMRRGARTFVHKPWDNTTLARIVRREIDEGLALRKEGARASRELGDARQIQRALLPATFPELEGCDIAAKWEPASAFGGDCYDALRFSGTRMGLSIADVQGKGLPAALLMSNLQASVRAFAGDDVQPEDLAANINRALCRNVGLGTFVTFFYAVLDCAARSITFCNAGHNPPILVHEDGSVDRLAAGGVVLGIFEDTRYERGRVMLQPGDRLVLFTDGMTEAENGDGLDFGDARLVETVVEHRSRSARGLLDAAFDRVRSFAGGQFLDDATLIALSIQ